MIGQSRIDPESRQMEQRSREALRHSDKLTEQTKRLIQESRALLQDYALSGGRIKAIQGDSWPTQAE
jgi:hypothetical protein